MNKKRVLFIKVVALIFCNFNLSADDNTVLPEKPMVVVIPSYNNEEWVEKNLGSVFFQKYSNYRVIYINDCSDDSTFEVVDRFVKEQGQSTRCTLINNKQRCGALANLYNAIHSCSDEEIIVALDGDDWLADNIVLSYLNEIYSTKEVWMTYGQYSEYPKAVRGFNRGFPKSVIENNTYRSHRYFPVSHLRTFKAWLFKKIELKDLLYRGEFYWMTWDKAMMAPMLEMSGGRFESITRILYRYNAINPISDHRVDQGLQRKLSTIILSQEPYKPLSQIQKISKPKIDVIIFSNNTQICDDMLSSLRHKLTGVHQIKVVPTIFLAKEYGNVTKIEENKEETQDSIKIKEIELSPFKLHLLDVINKSSASHILFLTDDDYITQSIDLKKCAEVMNETFAAIFSLERAYSNDYYEQNTKEPKFIPLSGNVKGWQFRYGPRDWWHTYNLTKNLYPIEDVKKYLEVLEYCSLQELQSQWLGRKFNGSDIGLCFFEPLIMQR